MSAHETQIEFARRHGVSKQCISQHVRAGRIPLTPAGLIDPDVGDIAAATHLERHRKLAPSAAEAHLARAAEAAPASPGAQPETSAAAMHVAKTLQAKYAALREKLEYEVRLGQLVQRTDVELAAANAARQLRDRLLALPVRIAGELAHEQDPETIARALTAQLRPILDEFETYALEFDATDLAADE